MAAKKRPGKPAKDPYKTPQGQAYIKQRGEDRATQVKRVKTRQAVGKKVAKRQNKSI